jgi:glycosyltransferase involved in cell wall biosynthesis
MGAGNAVVAHDNRFNRWVAGPQALYFEGTADLALALDELLPDGARLARMRAASRQRFEQAFTWPAVLAAYERLLTRWLPAPQTTA